MAGGMLTAPMPRSVERFSQSHAVKGRPLSIHSDPVSGWCSSTHLQREPSPAPPATRTGHPVIQDDHPFTGMSLNIPLDVYFKKRHGISEHLFESLHVVGLTGDEKGKVLQETAGARPPKDGPRGRRHEGQRWRKPPGIPASKKRMRSSRQS